MASRNAQEVQEAGRRTARVVIDHYDGNVPRAREAARNMLELVTHTARPVPETIDYARSVLAALEGTK